MFYYIPFDEYLVQSYQHLERSYPSYFYRG